MLSRKDYEAIAEIISKSEGRYGTLYELAKQFANYFQVDNLNFDRKRFMEACGLGD